MIRDGIPYRELTQVETSALRSYCAEEPPVNLQPSKESIRSFLGFAGKTLVEGHYPVQPLVMNAKQRALRATNFTSDTIGLSFNRGVYAYAGILGSLGKLEEIIIEPEVANAFNRRTDDDPLLLAIELYESGTAIPAFRPFADTIAPVLIGEDIDDKRALLMGAGAMHDLVTASDRQREVNLLQSLE